MENKGYAKFLGANKLHYGRFASGKSFLPGLFIAISRKVSKKNVHATIPKGIGMLSNLLLLLSFSTRRYMSMTSPAILSNFFEKQWTQNHPQYLSGLSRALYPTTIYCVKPWLFVTTFCIIIQKTMLRDEGVMPGNNAAWQNRFRNKTLP